MKERAPGQAGARPGILVVDDSAVTREVLSLVLSKAGFEVQTAATGEIALRRMAAGGVDAVILDLMLPDQSGLELMKLMPEPRPPIVICSSLAARDAAMALAALEAGAVSVIGKPEMGLQDYLEGSAERILGAVREALQSREGSLRPPRGTPLLVSKDAPRPRLRASSARPRAIAIGASTGGVEALHHVLPALPADLPPIVVVQHMPAAFCKAFAQRLDQRSKLEVRVAQDGDQLVDGRVFVAMGGWHLRVSRAGPKLVCRLDASEAVKHHRPSVDVLFGSLARSVGDACLAVLLTGMGNDGVDGMLELRKAGAVTIAQDENSSMVYGMPREAARRGAASEVLPLERVASRLIELCRQ